MLSVNVVLSELSETEVKFKKKSKTVPLHTMLALRGEGVGYSSYSFLTLVLDEVLGQRHAPAALYPRWKTPLTVG
jgi:hypothetical protein